MSQPTRTALFLTFALLAAPGLAWGQAQVETVAAELDGAVGGVAVDALGFVYVADFGEKVWKIDPFGKVEVLVDSLYGTSGNAIDGEGRLLQASFNAGTLSRISRDGKVQTFARGLKGPVGVTVDPEGNAYVCNCRANTLSKVTPRGEVTTFAESPLLNCPNGITHHADGRLFVVNFSDGKMLEVSTEGEVSHFADIPGGGNGHVAQAGGAFYVTGFRSNQIYLVSMEGKVSTFAGTGAFAEADGPLAEAAFSSPNGIAFDPTRLTLYTNDFLVPFAQRRKVPSKNSVRKIVLPSLRERFQQAYQEQGLDAAITAYHAFRKGNPSYAELITNRLGYELLQKGKAGEAVRVFELNAQDYPQSFNAWDSLAEGHKAAGEREQAIHFYRKSLELNPKNTNATQMLEELGAK